jgi:hypothetical protein
VQRGDGTTFRHTPKPLEHRTLSSVSRSTIVALVIVVVAAGSIGGAVWYETRPGSSPTGSCGLCSIPPRSTCEPDQLVLTAPNSSSPFPATATQGGTTWYNYSLVTGVCTRLEPVADVYFSVQSLSCGIANGVTGVSLTPNSTGELHLSQGPSTGWWNVSNASLLNSPADLSLTATLSLAADQLLIDYGQTSEGGIQVYEGEITPGHPVTCTPSPS